MNDIVVSVAIIQYVRCPQHAVIFIAKLDHSLLRPIHEIVLIPRVSDTCFLDAQYLPRYLHTWY